MSLLHRACLAIALVTSSHNTIAMQPCEQPDKKIQIGLKSVGHLSEFLCCPFEGTCIYCNRFLAQCRTEWRISHGIWLPIDSHHGVQALFNFDRSGSRFQYLLPVAGSGGRFQQ